ncbi:MAG: sugar transferase [Candidatus Kapabacteria bacterium]|nr:sugar transferase [Candidatus Kapabacteria bacterium]
MVHTTRSTSPTEGIDIAHIRLPRSPVVYQIAFDMLGFAVSFALYYMLRFFSGLFQTSNHALTQPFVSSERLAVIAAAVCALYVYWAMLLWFAGLYEDWYVRSPFDEFFTVVRVTFIGCCILGLLIFLDDLTPAQNPRLLILLYWVALCSGICLGRIAARMVQRALRIRGYIAFPTVLVGSASHVRSLLTSVCQAPAFGFRPIGAVMVNVQEVERWYSTHQQSTDSTPHSDKKSPDMQVEACHSLPRSAPEELQPAYCSEAPVQSWGAMTEQVQELPLIGVLSDMPMILPRLRPAAVLVSTENPDHEELLRLANECEKHGVTLKVVPDLYEIFSGQTRTQHVYGMALIEINPQIMTPWQRIIKRFMDIVLSLLGILLGLPLWILIAVIVALETPGGAFYSQIRVGRGGVPFRIWKFRSMTAGADAITGFTKVNDARVTRFGRIIRKTHLDEIPQLWNILKGDMSIVGPRPEVPKLVEKFTEKFPYYPRRHKVRPGLTGWYQLHALNYSDDDDEIRRRLKYDFYYIENISFRLDVEIIVRTIFKVLRGSGQA